MERVNTDTAGACPRETHRVERVNTGTAGVVLGHAAVPVLTLSRGGEG